MRASRLEPEKIKNPKVRLLYELALVLGLSPKDIAPVVPASVMQIYRWFRGDEPKPGSLALIERACEKLRALPEPGRGAYRPDEARAATLSALLGHQQEEGGKQTAPAAEDKFQSQMKRVFEELEPKLTSNEKYVIFVANPGCWQSFIEVLALCRKYGVKIPK